MNTRTGNIFGLNDEPLGENEVELSAAEFADLFPIRDLNERLRMYREMQRPTEFRPLGDATEPEPNR